MLIQSPKGTRDILPSQTQTWQWVEKIARSVFSTYGYQEIRTPIFESTDLFVRGVGDTTDIVEKEMFTFNDKANRSITLRPEGTASVVRAVLQNRLLEGSSVVKLYYNGRMYRYERPQAGRYREHWQVGVEVFGAAQPAVDAEVIALAHQFYSTLGFKDLMLHLNTIGDRACRPKYVADLKAFTKARLDEFCRECQGRYERNPLRLFDCKKGCREILAESPRLLDYLCDPCHEHFDAVKRYLKLSGIDYTENLNLVRGMDYYSRTTFEFTAGGLGAQDAIGGGGRYDYLVEELGNKQTPAIGFGLGVDRIILALEAQNVGISLQPPIDVYIAVLGDEAMPVAFQLAQRLRERGIRTDLEYNGRGLKAQMKTANKLNVQHVVIIGEDEIKDGAATVREMESGNQWTIAFDRLAEELSKTSRLNGFD